MALSHAPSLFLFPPQTSLIPSPTSLLPHGLKPRIRPIPFLYAKRGRVFSRCLPAVVEDAQQEVVLHLEEDESEKSSITIEEYDWREEWYPLYLSSEVPSDAPLGLTVFHKQLVLYRDGAGLFRCFEDRCPHRLAKLSEGQLIDGRLECLYHGWQFEGDGKCVKIPQLPDGAKIPRGACARTYQARDSQGVVWVWMSNKSPPNNDKLPFFEQFELPGFSDISTIHELPYDHSILLENLMDPAHVPISHDRTDLSARREDAQPLVFDVVERTSRGFAGRWWQSKNPESVSFSRFQAPCVLSNSREIDDGKGGKRLSSAFFLCRPAGQGKSMLIVRFGTSSRPFLSNFLPQWILHHLSSNVFEQDMGFLSSQNEVLMKAKVPTKDLYLNLKFCDTWVVEYRRWMDKVGHGMPYYFGHGSVSLPKEPAVVEEAPVGFVAGISSSFPTKGGVGDRYAPNPANRYYRHVVHCKECRSSLQWFRACRNALLVLSVAAAAAAVLAAARQWKALFIAASGVLFAGACACTGAVGLMTTNLIRKHRRL